MRDCDPVADCMTCDACAAAKIRPRIDLWESGCDSCLARALAVTGAHNESKVAGRVTSDYQRILKGMFGDRWKDGAALVKNWAGIVDRSKP